VHDANVIFREVKEMIAEETDKKKRMKLVKRLVKMQVNKEVCPLCKTGVVDIDGIHMECANGHFWFNLQDVVKIRKTRGDDWGSRKLNLDNHKIM